MLLFGDAYDQAFHAVKHGDVKKLNALIHQEGFDLNRPDKRGLSLIENATFYGQVDAFDHLACAPGVSMNLTRLLNLALMPLGASDNALGVSRIPLLGHEASVVQGAQRITDRLVEDFDADVFHKKKPQLIKNLINAPVNALGTVLGRLTKNGIDLNATYRNDNGQDDRLVLEIARMGPSSDDLKALVTAGMDPSQGVRTQDPDRPERLHHALGEAMTAGHYRTVNDLLTLGATPTPDDLIDATQARQRDRDAYAHKKSESNDGIIGGGVAFASTGSLLLTAASAANVDENAVAAARRRCEESEALCNRFREQLTPAQNQTVDAYAQALTDRQKDQGWGARLKGLFTGKPASVPPIPSLNELAARLPVPKAQDQDLEANRLAQVRRAPR